MQNNWIAILLTIVGSIIYPAGHSLAMNDFVEYIDKECMINWTTGSLTASGFQAVQKNEDGEIMDSEKALMAARQMAHNNLLKAAKSVRISGAVDVGAFAGHDEDVMARLMGMIKNTAVSNQQYSTNGTVEVFMNMSFFGGFSQLVLPKEIQHVEPITAWTHPKGQMPPGSGLSSEQQNQKKEIYSGLVVDARGLDILPVLSPRILDENNMEIYGPAFVSREIAVQKGICLYEGDITAAKTNERVLDKPLVVKALRVKQPSGSELVISNTDAQKIKSASEHLAFLKQCRVIIVIDEKAPLPGNA